MPGKHIGFVSTRFSGTDGVSLESCKWAQLLEQNGHRCYWFGGELNRPENRSLLVEEAHFRHHLNEMITEQVMDGKKSRTPLVTRSVHELRSKLKMQIHDFIERFQIDLLIAENALTIPMHVPLGLALTEAIAETRLPTIAHHHDFYWERVRFSVNAVGDYLRMAFPPNLSNIQHVVINSDAQEQLAHRTGISSVVIPNVLDFDHPPVIDTQKAAAFKESIGLAPEDCMILQPTRIVQRKGIEYAIELVKALGNGRHKLVISHEAGDEGFAYADWLKDYAWEHRVDLRLVSSKLEDPWMCNAGSGNSLSLWDVYPYADFITYPSLYEGFGNGFLEAVYFKKPMLINRYATFVRDIEPLGFDLAVMDGYLDKDTIETVRSLLDSPRRRRQMVEHNYAVARKHYSYTVLMNRLNGVLHHLFGDDIAPLGPLAVQQSLEGLLEFSNDSVVYRRYGGNRQSDT